MLTWIDIAKLCVPFVFSLVLIWAKDWYEKARERKAKQEFLWREISHESNNLSEALSQLDKIAEAFKNNKFRIVDFDLPANLTEFGNRLCELDSSKAYVYCGYTSGMAIVNKGLGSLKSLIADFPTADKEQRVSIAIGIEVQAKNIKKDLVKLARREIDVLRIIQKSSPKKYDTQVIKQHEIAVEKASAAIQERERGDK